MGCGTSQQKVEKNTSVPTKLEANKNRQEEQNNDHRNNEIVQSQPPQTQPEYTYYVYQLIYQIPNVFVYEISFNGPYQLLTYGNLDIMQYNNNQDGSYQYLLQVNANFFYFLNKSIGILESPESGDMFSTRRHFICPGIDCNYDICIMNIQQFVMIQYLEAILAENANLFVPEVQIQPIQPQYQQQQQQQQQEQQLVEIDQQKDKEQLQQEDPQKKSNFLSGVLNKGGDLLKQGGQLIKKGIKVTSKFICFTIQKTGDFLKKKLPKSSKEYQIDPQIMNFVAQAHEKKKQAFKLTGGVISEASKQAMQIAKRFTKNTNTQNTPGGAVVSELVGIYDEMLDAINVVEQNMINNAAELVEEKLGHDAGVLARQGLEIGIINVEQMAKKQVVKGIQQEM